MHKDLMERPGHGTPNHGPNAVAPPCHSCLARTKATISTMEVLYQLSYPGGRINFSGGGTEAGTRG